MNSAALFSPFFFDFDLDFLCFLLRCDPERLLDLDRPRDDEEDDEELEEDEDDLLLLLELRLSTSFGLPCPFLALDSVLLPPEGLLLLLLLLRLLLLVGMASQKKLRGEVLTKEAGRPHLPQAPHHLLHHHVDDQDPKDVQDHTAGGSIRSPSRNQRKMD
jgi:hypothetical protein